MKRFLLLHSKSDDDARISVLLQVARDAIEPRSRGKPFEVMPGRDFYTARFKACGSWDAWTTEAATGTSYPDHMPYFDGFLVPTPRFGSGTGQIVEKALRAGKPVFAIRSDGSLAKVLAVRQVDKQDWKTGYAVTVGPFS
jgi:hypothetical protein